VKQQPTNRADVAASFWGREVAKIIIMLKLKKFHVGELCAYRLQKQIKPVDLIMD
jgi:hypothetical protein